MDPEAPRKEGAGVHRRCRLEVPIRGRHRHCKGPKGEKDGRGTQLSSTLLEGAVHAFYTWDQYRAINISTDLATR